MVVAANAEGRAGICLWHSLSIWNGHKRLAGALGSRVASTALRHFPSGYTSFSKNVLQGLGYSATGFFTEHIMCICFTTQASQPRPLLQAGNEQQHCAAGTAATAVHICKSGTGRACVSHSNFLHRGKLCFPQVPDAQFSTRGLK